MITHKLYQVINEVVSPAQSIFIRHMHIADNMLLATELIIGYTRRHMSPKSHVKVNIKKAYDSMEWVFLNYALGARFS